MRQGGWEQGNPPSPAPKQAEERPTWGQGSREGHFLGGDPSHPLGPLPHSGQESGVAGEGGEGQGAAGEAAPGAPAAAGRAEA